jgi:FkbM family methyltransferase
MTRWISHLAQPRVKLAVRNLASKPEDGRNRGSPGIDFTPVDERGNDRIGPLPELLRQHPSSRFLASVAFRLASQVREPQIGLLATGEPMLLNLAEHIQRWIYMYGTYEEPTTRYLQRNATDGWVFIDVGSCEGYYAVLAVALGGCASRVIAIEPNPPMADQLQETVRLGRYPIEILAVGCGSTRGMASLTVSDIQGNIGMSSLVHQERGRRTVEVPVETLDGICGERNLCPDVVKIDVEGFEMEVLRGFGRTLQESPPRLILVELVSREPSHAAAMEHLIAFGYRAERVHSDGTTSPLSSTADLPAEVELVAFTHGV